MLDLFLLQIDEQLSDVGNVFETLGHCRAEKGSGKGVRFNFCYASLMPRRPRIHLDGVPLHIVQRGHNRGACFFDERDYHAYRGWLGEALQRERCALHAYVLMSNHVDLLMTPEKASAIPQRIRRIRDRP
ncbi:MAG: transposase [Pseudomonadota bacterium]|nr:transposase [Pseudomonadota bacterium]MEA3276892.1 transposase [Pseudomonadota bacterium]